MHITVHSTLTTPLPLFPGETIIFRSRRSFFFLIVPLVLFSAVGIGLYLMINNLLTADFFGGFNLSRFLIILTIGSIIFIDLVIVLDWLLTIYTLTNKRVQLRFGIIGLQHKSISLEEVTNTRSLQGVLGRIFGFGNVFIEAAGRGSQIILAGVSNPIAHKELIDEAVEAAPP